MKIGILSDTHGLLRPEVISALQSCEAILHAGDINRQEVLDQLIRIAPVRAVRGNNDKEWAEYIPLFLDFSLAGIHICMTHMRKELPKDLNSYDLAICGHSHQYTEQRIGRTILLNPGSCGPRRFHQPITMATVEITDGGIVITRIEIAHVSANSFSKIDREDIRQIVEIVCAETMKGRSPAEIARRYVFDVSLTEQIARLYVTHPNVTINEIMTKMEL